MKVEVGPIISAAYLHRVTGVRFDERFFNDAEHCAREMKKLEEASAAVIPPDFRRAPAPRPPATDMEQPGPLAIGVGQPFLIIAGLFGARFHYYDGYYPNAANRPLEEWTLAQIARLEPPDVAHTWPLDEYLARYDALVARYGPERIPVPAFMGRHRVSHGAEYHIAFCHSPVTLAFRLRGEKLFLDMADDPGVTQHLLDVVVETMRRCIDLMAAKAGVPVELMYQPCCVGALLSRRVFEEWDLPAMLKLFHHYGVKNRIHSCGASTHLLEGLAQIPNLIELELGEGTDMAMARRLWPEASLIYIPDSPRLPGRTVEEIKNDFKRVIEEAGSGPLTFQMILEDGMSLEQFHAAYDVVREHNARDCSVRAGD